MHFLSDGDIVYQLHMTSLLCKKCNLNAYQGIVIDLIIDVIRQVYK